MAIDNHHLICSIFCNVSKAFNRVYILGLSLKLKRYGIWKSYITENKGDGASEQGKLKVGVPQWSILTPLFFLIYKNYIADNMIEL